MITAHRPWEHDHLHLRALEATFELRMDVLCDGSRPSNSGSRFNVYSHQRLLGTAPVILTDEPHTIGARMHSRFGPGDLKSPSGRILCKGAERGSLHQEIFADEQCSGRLLLNIFAKRHSDGRVAHIFRLVSSNLDQAVQESAASDAVNAETTGLQEVFSGHHISDIGFTCAPPKADDISPQAMQMGAAWLAKTSIRSGLGEDRGTIDINLDAFFFLSRESLDGGLRLGDVNIRRVLEAYELVRWSDVRKLMERPHVFDWMASSANEGP